MPTISMGGGGGGFIAHLSLRSEKLVSLTFFKTGASSAQQNVGQVNVGQVNVCLKTRAALFNGTTVVLKYRFAENTEPITAFERVI